jgi:hypothetical protein
MRHQKSRTFDRNYLSQHVRRDVQNIYRGLPEHPAVRAAAQMSTNMDPRAPYKTEEQRALVHQHPDIVSLNELKSVLSKKLRVEYGGVQQGRGTELYQQYKRAHLDLMNEQKAQEYAKKAELRDQYFNTIHSITLQQQLSAAGSRSLIEEREVLEKVNVFPERTRIADAFFFSPKPVDQQELFEQRIKIITDLTALCSLCEVRRRGNFRQRKKKQSMVGMTTQEKEIEEVEKVEKVEKVEEVEACIDPGLYPLICPDPQCLFCLGDEGLLRRDRERIFARIDSLRRHVQKVHLASRDADKPISCPHPACAVILDNVMVFKNHAATVHNIFY